MAATHCADGRGPGGLGLGLGLGAGGEGLAPAGWKKNCPSISGTPGQVTVKPVHTFVGDPVAHGTVPLDVIVPSGDTALARGCHKHTRVNKRPIVANMIWVVLD